LITAVGAGGLAAALALFAAVRVLTWLDLSAGRGLTTAVVVWTVAWACIGTWTGQPLFTRLTARPHRH
jgi:hypothetical protein